VPFKARGIGENGLELTVTAFQRPLQVQGLAQGNPNLQFVLASVRIHNTKTSGAAILLRSGDFILRGDGGLPYSANPRSVTIENLMMPQESVAPGVDLERELIFEIAQDDSGLMLYWTAGRTTRQFMLEASR
jgi:hypothetical protein